MVWSQTLTTELVLPSDAVPGPGSGAFVIVGPDNLPPELAAYFNPVGQVSSAIIWYSTPTNLVNSRIAYQFLAYLQINSGTTAMTVIQGYASDTLVIFVQQQWQAKFPNDPNVGLKYSSPVMNWSATGSTQNSLMALLGSNWQVVIANGSAGGQNGATQLLFDNVKALYNVWSSSDGTSSGQARLAVDGTAKTATLTSPTDTSLDTWNSASTSGSDGFGNAYTALWLWKITFDRIIDARVNVSWSSPPAPTGVNFTPPAAMPKPDLPPGYPSTAVIVGVGLITDGSIPANIPMTPYSPVVTGTVTNPTLTSNASAYAIVNGVVTANFQIVLNTVGSGIYDVQLPAPISSSWTTLTAFNPLGPGVVISGASRASGFWGPGISLLNVRLLIASSFTSFTTVTNVFPFAMAAGTLLNGTVSYVTDQVVSPSRTLVPVYLQTNGNWNWRNEVALIPAGTTRWMMNATYAAVKPTI